MRRGLVPAGEHYEEEGKALHVEHVEIEERPEVHVEREIIVDTEEIQEEPGTETTIEKKVTRERRRRKNEVEEAGFPRLD